MALNPARVALLGVTILGASCLAAMADQCGAALGQTVTPPTEVLIDRDPIAVPPPNVPVIRRPVAPAIVTPASPSVSTTSPTNIPNNIPNNPPTNSPTNDNPSLNGFSNSGFSASNAPAPVATPPLPPVTASQVMTPPTTRRQTARTQTIRPQTIRPQTTGTVPMVSSRSSGNNLTNGNYSNYGSYRNRSGSAVSYSAPSSGNLINRSLSTPAVTTVAASDPVSFPTNLPTNAPVPSGNPEVPTDVNQLFAFLSQNIPPVDGAAGELNYTVVVPGTADSLLNQIQEIIPTAKVVSSRMGACIQVQAYRDRGRAESLTAMLRSVGFDARVLHQNGG